MERLELSFGRSQVQEAVLLAVLSISSMSLTILALLVEVILERCLAAFFCDVSVLGDGSFNLLFKSFALGDGLCAELGLVQAGRILVPVVTGGISTGELVEWLTVVLA